jgi:hypothetical protein
VGRRQAGVPDGAIRFNGNRGHVADSQNETKKINPLRRIKTIQDGSQRKRNERQNENSAVPNENRPVTAFLPPGRPMKRKGRAPAAWRRSAGKRTAGRGGASPACRRGEGRGREAPARGGCRMEKPAAKLRGGRMNRPVERAGRYSASAPSSL